MATPLILCDVVQSLSVEGLLVLLWFLIGGFGVVWLTIPNASPSQAQVLDARKTQADQQLKAAEHHMWANQLLAAQTELERALTLYRAIADQNGQHVTLISLGDVYYRQGDYRQALLTLQQSERLPQNQDIAQQGRRLSIQGLVYLELGDYRQAWFTLQKAQGRQIKDFAAENRTRIGLGEAYYALGWYQQALTYLRQATRSPGDRGDLGRAYESLGDVYLGLGQYPEALDTYQDAWGIRRAVGDRLSMARTLNRLGRAKAALDQFTEALGFYEQALSIMTGLGDQAGKVAALNNLGQMYLDLNQPEQALNRFQEALGHSRASDGAGRVTTLLNLGLYYRLQNQPGKAISLLEEALGWARNNGDRIGEMRAWSELGKTRLQLDKPAKAAQALQASIDIFESLRPGLRDEQKVSLFETQRQTYQTWQKALVAQGEPQAALVVAERSRARAFIELLAQRLSGEALPTTVVPLTLEAIQATANANQATLVTYSIVYDEHQHESELYIWVIPPTGRITFRSVNLRSLEFGSDLSLSAIAKDSQVSASTGREKRRPVLKDVVGAFRSSLLEQPVPTLTALRNGYEVLIQPIADHLPSDPKARVILIPQDFLFLVPFPALQDRDSHFLLETHTVLVSPSIQALALAPTRPIPTQKLKALIVGNPEPMPEQLVPLPGAAAEAHAIAQLLGTEPLLGRQATQSNVLEQITQANIIHFATHGLLDDQQGLQSSLALAAVDHQDSFLTADDLMNRPLNASLAVLSACNTGRGQITGDGVMGLSRSLMVAGVPSVIVTLWSVPDLPTATLITDFYRNWQTGTDKAQSLRQAMLKMHQENPNPRYWAGFVLIGRAD